MVGFNWTAGLAAVSVVLLVIGGLLYSGDYSEGPIFLVAGVVAALFAGIAQLRKRPQR
jgi:hypothetical protein